MTVPQSYAPVRFVANGVTTVFPFDFLVFNADDIQVLLNGTEVTQGFTITGLESESGGSIVFITPPAFQSVILISRVLPLLRKTDYQDNGDLLADTINRDFDRRVMTDQQLQEQIDRAVKVPPDSETDPDDLIAELKEDAARAEAARDGAEVIANRFGDIDSAMFDINQTKVQTFFARDQAQGYAAVAESAATASLVAGNAYTTLAEAEAAIASGIIPNNAIFSVISSYDNNIVFLYQNIGGVATPLLDSTGAQKGYPSTKMIDSLIALINSFGLREIDQNISGLAFAITDQYQRTSWLQVGLNGNPTDYARDRIGDSLGVIEIDADAGGVAFAVTALDSQGQYRSSWIQVDHKGNPTDHTISILKSFIGSSSGNVTEAGPAIICPGDSLTAGAQGNGTTYPGVLQSLLSSSGYQNQVANGGVGGETSVTICARFGANPFMVLPRLGMIPASGSCDVDLIDINGQPTRPMLQGSTSSDIWTGSLNGVVGYLQIVKPNGGQTWDPANYYTFTRLTAGSAVVCNRPTPFRTTYSESKRGDIQVIWIGQNGPSNERAIADARALFNHGTAVKRKALFISKPSSTDAEDSAWHDAFGRNFIAIRKYLVEYGLADAGITPTAQDLIDISNGVVPTSLRGDSVHLNAAGYTIVGQQVFKRLVELYLGVN